MGTWLDFLQVALALGMGWLGLVMFAIARPFGFTSARSRRRSRAFVQPHQRVMGGRTLDRER